MNKLLRAAMVLMLGLVATLVVASPAHATTVAFSRTTSWPTGYVADMTVTNNFNVTITGWEVAFQLPEGAIVNVWNAQLASRTPHYSVIPVSWHGPTLAPGDWVTFSMVVSGTDEDPTILWPK